MEHRPEEGAPPAEGAETTLAKRPRLQPRPPPFAPTFLPPPVDEPSGSGCIAMPKEKFDSLCDSIGRAYNATRHAQRLSAAAATAFASEADVLLEAKAALDAIRATYR